MAYSMHEVQVSSTQAENMNTTSGNAATVDVQEEHFEAEVLQSTQPVLVEFWAPWSRPCQIEDSILTEIAAAWAGKGKVVKINADDCLDLSLYYDIQSVPTLLYFVEGKPRLRIVGTASKQAILAKLRPFGVPGETPASGTRTMGTGRAALGPVDPAEG